MSYRFKKRYLDLVAEDGTVLVIYQTQTRLSGMICRRSGLEVYAASNAPEILMASGADEQTSHRHRTVRLHLDEGPLVVEVDVQQGGWSPTFGASMHFDWSVDFARADIAVRWPSDSNRPALAGTGYADLVELRRLPRRLRLRRLDWGRIHLDRGTAIFTSTRFLNGTNWQRLIWWELGAEPLEHESFHMEQGDASTLIAIPGLSLHLDPVRLLHSGPAISRDRFPSSVERWLTTAAAGSLRESRKLSRAVATGPDWTDSGWAVHETVIFGRSPEDRPSNN